MKVVLAGNTWSVDDESIRDINGGEFSLISPLISNLTIQYLSIDN